MTKVALITGGAGGIAARLAPRLQARGYRLLLVDVDAARLAAAADVSGPGTAHLAADLSTAAGRACVVEAIAAEPALDLLVNAAGIVEPGSVAALDGDALERHIAINLLAPMRLSQAAARAFVPRGRGCILSLVSVAGLVALPGSAAYSASKFGLRGFQIALSEELAGSGVRVRGVFPGAVDTPMLRHEATHGGSVLNFLNRDVLSADAVAEVCLRAIDGTRLETFLPAGDGWSARLLSAWPGLLPRLMPLLRRQGEAGLQRFLQSRGLTAAPRDDSPPT
ncbi:SDR family NAD(P)-dependent oxidoreductase [Solimonas marina]|uniref:SDR family NAD(P)-dependent oxidoreductase n=1 Tax=Solimonas marina TaxID=2714601 RepID=A0A970B9T2_9GAMM|nr:SDR family NAD(P)-dependent oxidoreductase [Solimonas marina]NKF23679.1 SDR family NAD(P)-dependent oxidoreductase [Solimonas marina]